MIYVADGFSVAQDDRTHSRVGVADIQRANGTVSAFEADGTRTFPPFLFAYWRRD